MSKATDYADKKFRGRDALATYFPVIRLPSDEDFESTCKACSNPVKITYASLCSACFDEAAKHVSKRNA